MPRVLLVLGMHRSGTSAVAGSLAELGVDLGASLMPSRAGENAKGFFEVPFLEHLHDRALEALGRTWDDPRPLPPNWIDSRQILGFRRELEQWLGDAFANRELFAIKDPRLSVLLPLWSAVLEDMGVASSAVLVTRNRVSVMQSLRTRDGMPEDLAEVLIAGYLLAAERESRGMQRAVIAYEDLLARPIATLSSLGEALDVTWPRSPSSCEEDLLSFLDPSLCHNGSSRQVALTSTDGNQEMLEALDQGIEQLRAGATQSAIHTLDRAEELLEGIVQGMAPAAFAHASRLHGRSNREFERLESILAERGAHLHALEAHLHALEAEIAGLRSELQRSLVRIRIPASLRRLRRLPSLAVRALISPRWAMQRAKYKLRVLRDRGRAGAGATKKPCTFERLSSPQTLSRLEGLGFDEVPNPTVSIVIPVYGKIDLLVQCLESIRRCSGSKSFEIVLVDDCSPTPMAAELAAVEGLSYFRNETNLGFVQTCNRGALESRGEFLVFLNSDTQVTAGWLEQLLGTFDEIPAAGLVGAQLLYPDGTLQEAGGIVWRDGSAWNYGKGESASHPNFNHARRVDYCSGACLAIRRSLFLELGMFDLEFAPGYYEDADLAFRVREAGWEVWYQPAVTIYHVEGASAGRDESSGMKQFQVRNRTRFLNRWRETLLSHRENGVEPELERDRGIRGRLLFLDHRTLTPDQDSGSVRTWNLLRILRDMGHKVTFLPENLFAEEPYTAQKLAMGVEVVHSPHIRSVSEFLRERGSTFDTVIVSRLSVAKRQLQEVRRHCPQARILYDTVDLHFLRLEREAEIQDSAVLRREAKATRATELDLCTRADATLVVSTYEAELLSRLLPSCEVHVVSNVVEIPGTLSPFGARAGALFVGGFEHPANADAVTWFAREVVPLLVDRIPNFVFHIVGSKPTADIFKLNSKHIKVHGHVPQLLPLLEECRLSVAPLRFGAGVKGKVNQSLAHGLPCVATPIAVEGMGLIHGTDILVADGPEQTAELVVEVHESEELWNRLSHAGVENTRRLFSFDVARQALHRALNSSTRPSSSQPSTLGRSSRGLTSARRAPSATSSEPS